MSHSHVCNHGNCLSGVLQLQTSRKPSAKESVYYNVAPILEVLENPQHISWAKDKKLKKKKSQTPAAVWKVSRMHSSDPRNRLTFTLGLC